MSFDLNRKNAKTQTAYSSRYCKHCEHLKIIRMQNFKQQFLEICFIMNIKVNCDDTSTYLYTFLCCSSSILCKNSNCMLQIVKKCGAIRKKVGTLLVSS